MESKTFIPDFVCYTDGSCDNMSEYGEGGSAYIITDGRNVIRQQSKGFIGTTNNRMELLAIMSAVASLPPYSKAIVVTDSKYCIEKLGDSRNKGQRFYNSDIIDRYFQYADKLSRIHLQWVKGHSGDCYNEMADELARSRMEEMREKYGIDPRRKDKQTKTNPV